MATDDHDRGPDKGKPVSPSELRRLLLRVIDYQEKMDAKIARIEARTLVIEAMLKGMMDTQAIDFCEISSTVDDTDRRLTPDEVSDMLGDFLRKGRA